MSKKKEIRDFVHIDFDMYCGESADKLLIGLQDDRKIILEKYPEAKDITFAWHSDYEVGGFGYYVFKFTRPETDRELEERLEKEEKEEKERTKAKRKARQEEEKKEKEAKKRYEQYLKLKEEFGE